MCKCNAFYCPVDNSDGQHYDFVNNGYHARKAKILDVKWSTLELKSRTEQ